ncbi:MAG: hypothetical protein CSA84_07540 [Actinomycetales bacterium]|nr:MAG: hypothetical protein CSA84_07540 [Actinomycetales bacterium]
MYWMAIGEHDLPDDNTWLSAIEADKLAGIRFAKRRNEYLLRRYVGKRAVAVILGRPLASEALAGIEILNRDDGSPYVRVDGQHLAFELSLADRAGWAVALVSGQLAGNGTRTTPGAGTIGIDLELVEPRSPGFVTDWLTSTEQEHLRGLPGEDSQAQAANLIWSAKEAALKVFHTGLRADTRSVEVSLGTGREVGGWAPLVVEDRTGVAEGSLTGWWRRDHNYVVTVVTCERDDPPHLLEASSALAEARPSQSWLVAPLAD